MSVSVSAYSDLLQIITTCNELSSNVNTETVTAEFQLNSIMSISKYIMDSDIDIPEGKQEFSIASLGIMQKLTAGEIISCTEINNWLQIVRRRVAFIYNLLSVKMSESEFCYSEDRPDASPLFSEFFKDSEDSIITCAHYHALRRLAKSDPMRCYQETCNDFARCPTFLKDLIEQIEYVYDPAKIRDTLYDQCPICGSDTLEPFYCSPQVMSNNNAFAPAKLWMKCNKCNNLFAYNFPTIDVAANNGHYTSDNNNLLLTPKQPLFFYGDIFNRIRKICDGTKYLEIGVGNGEMLAVALEMGYDVSAVEICEEDCRNISGALDVDITLCDFMQYQTEELFDVIIMGDVLEHVAAPIKMIEKACSMLNKGGVLWLSTPNYKSAYTRMRKFEDPKWKQNNHFTYFSFDGILPFLKKAGLNLKRYDVSNRYNGSMELYLQAS